MSALVLQWQQKNRWFFQPAERFVTDR